MPAGWATITAAEAAERIGSFRAGVDTLAMVGGHGIDVLDIDRKAGGDLEDVPAELRGYGVTESPSKGWHVPIPSTGFGKGDLRIAGKYQGDYVGGTADGGGRLLCFLPGSVRPRYPGLGYVELQRWDIDRLLEDEPSELLIGLLEASGLSRTAKVGKGAVSDSEASKWLADHRGPTACNYGERALLELLRESGEVRTGGRHAWMIHAVARVVELVKAGCLNAEAVEALAAAFHEIKRGHRWEFLDAVAWAIANTQPADCTHGKPPRLLEEPENPQGFLDWSTFWREDLEPAAYLVPQLLLTGTAGVIYSAAGAGKSLLALEIAVGLATGGTVLGEPVEPVDVLYVDLEQDRSTVRERLEAFGVDEGTDLSRLHYSLLGDWSPLDSEAGGREILATAQRLGVQLVIVDTTSRTIAGGENDADTFHDLYRHTMRPLKAAGVAVLRLDHSGKDVEKGQRGSSAKVSDVDVVYRLVADGAEVTLRREKNRPHLEGPDVQRLRRHEGPLRHVPVHDSRREAERQRVRTEVLRALEGEPAELGKRPARAILNAAGVRVTERVLLEVLRDRKRSAVRPPAPIGGREARTTSPGALEKGGTGWYEGGTPHKSGPVRGNSRTTETPEVECSGTDGTRTTCSRCGSSVGMAEGDPECKACRRDRTRIREPEDGPE